MDKLKELKSEAYDLLAIIEEAQRQLQAKNQEIAKLMQQEKQDKPQTKEAKA